MISNGAFGLLDARQGILPGARRSGGIGHCPAIRGSHPNFNGRSRHRNRGGNSSDHYSGQGKPAAAEMYCKHRGEGERYATNSFRRLRNPLRCPIKKTLVAIAELILRPDTLFIRRLRPDQAFGLWPRAPAGCRRRSESSRQQTSRKSRSGRDGKGLEIVV